MMSVTWMGIALILVALGLFALDLKVTGHGLPAAWGILVLVAGIAMVSGAAAPYPWISSLILVSVVAFTVLLFVGVVASVPSAKRIPARTGAEGMVEEVGVAKSPISAGSQGWVFVHGERWMAALATAPEEASRDTIKPGQRVRVVELRNRQVLVVPYEPDASGRLIED